jgi:hypothetical protein
MDNLTKTENNVDSLNVRTAQAADETLSVSRALQKRKEEVGLLIQAAKEKVSQFFSQTFGSTTLNTAETLVYRAQSATAVLPELNVENAIPVSTV